LGISEPDGQRIPVWVLLIALATMVFGVADHDLWTPDEPREAEIGREMAAGSSLLVPHLAGEPFVEKPPLYYWVLALTIRLFGNALGTTAAARAASSVFSLLTLVALWLTARKSLPGNKAVVAAVVLATMVGFFHVSHWIIMDSLLMFFVTMAVMLFFIGLEHPKPFVLFGAYLAAGLAFMTKGLVAWALIALPWVAAAASRPRAVLEKPLRHALGGILLTAGPAAVWMAAFHSYGGQGAWHEWFFDNQLGRFLGRTHHLGHIKGPFYYLGVLPVVLLPWTPVCIAWLLERRWAHPPERQHGPSFPQRHLARVAAAWSWGGLLLLSLAGTKREIYLYPLLPGFALLIATSLEPLSRWVGVFFKVLSGLLVVAMAALAAIRPDYTGHAVSVRAGFHLPAALCAALGLLLFMDLRRHRHLVSGTAGIAALFYLAAVWSIVPVVDKTKGYGEAVRRFIASIPFESREGVCGWDLDETNRALIPYYTRLTLTNVRDTMRLQKILEGNDSNCSMIVTQKNRFPPPDTVVPRWEVVSEERLGVRRTLLLVAGADRPQRQRHP